jgi:hypothetical protein
VLLLLYEMKISCFFLLLFWAGQLRAQERCAQLPYTRYGSEEGRVSGASVVANPEATGRRFVCLKARGDGIEWPVRGEAQGIDIRFTLPDNASGTGVNGVLGLYVNGRKVQDVALSSSWAYQYFRTGESDPYQTPQEKTFMAFDEVHFRVRVLLKAGDVLRLEKDQSDEIAYGIDFIELEPLPAVVAAPAGSVSVTSYGAVPDDEQDDLEAFNAALHAAAVGGKCVYIPPGRYLLSDKWMVQESGVRVQGAGLWYTELYFSTNRQGYGGIVVRANGVEMAGFALNTANNARLQYAEEGARMPGSKYKQYKGFLGGFGTGSTIHDVWVEHFEAGFWIGETEGLKIINCRIRNNYADGVNFNQGTSRSVVENCSIRNNGDDGMAVWPNNGVNVQGPCVEDTFRNNTIEDNWRAAGAAIFGGCGHQIANNLFIGGVGGSGIRMTNDFPGWGFYPDREVITVINNGIIGSGTTADIWDNPKGAIELSATKGIYHVQFIGNEVDRSQWEPVHVVGKLGKVEFRGTKEDGREVKVEWH